jgi:hypothetical protein
MGDDTAAFAKVVTGFDCESAGFFGVAMAGAGFIRTLRAVLFTVCCAASTRKIDTAARRLSA